MRESEKYRVLFVEDDPGLRSMVTDHLQKEGYGVEAEESAEAVLDRIRSNELEYDVALTDLHLPGMSGVELNRLLVATAPLNPIIVVTGDDDAELARRAMKEGASGYLLKPFELFELEAALTQAVSLLELVETTETLARSQSQHLEEWGDVGGSLPRAWLGLGDEKSGAGEGHGARVVSFAILLAKGMGDALDSKDREILRTAARTHEIGRLVAGGSLREIAQRSAKLLGDLGFDERVCELVRQAVEPWSPGLSLRTRILSLADQLDHRAVRRASEQDDDVAIRSAVDSVVAAAGEDFDPEVAKVLESEREQVESMWVIQRQAEGSG